MLHLIYIEYFHKIGSYMSILFQDAQIGHIQRKNNHAEWGYFTVKYFELHFYVIKQKSLNYLIISDQHVIL